MNTTQTHKSRLLGGSLTVLAVLVLGLGSAVPLRAQYEVPQLKPGGPNPFTPTNSGWNRSNAFTLGGGSLVVTNVRRSIPSNITTGYARQNRIGVSIAPLNSQYGIGDILLPPDGVGPNWMPVVGTNGNPNSAQWISYANTNLFIAVDEGVAVVMWKTNVLATNGIAQTYVIGPNLTRRPVRLFWTEGQYTGPRVRFGNSYKVEIYYNSQIIDPSLRTNNVSAIAEERISEISPPTVFLKNGELRAAAGVKGRVLVAYSRRPEGLSTTRELLGYEVVDVLEPMSSTIETFVGSRLFPKRTDSDRNELFCDITRGGLDTTGVRPDEVFAYKHIIGQRNGWVWAIRPTDAPWQLEIFWKAKEQLDVIWPFEVDNYDVSWNLGSQLCARVDNRNGASAGVYFPQNVFAQVMPYQGIETIVTGATNYPKSSTVVARISGSVFTPVLSGMCTLKYTIGEDVWFETIRIVPEISSLVYRGVSSWSIGKELRPFDNSSMAPSASLDGWPGLLRIPSSQPTGPGIVNVPDDSRWDRYHPTLYRYPTGYPSTSEGLHSQIFAVNAGHLSVWWWNPTALVASEGLPIAIYWPSAVCDYRNEWPVAAPQIAIASFQGSASSAYYSDSTASLRFFGEYSAAIQVSAAVSNEWRNSLYSQGFTFETWIKPNSVSNYVGIMDMVSQDQTNHLSLFVKDGLLGALLFHRTTVWNMTTQEWYSAAAVLPGVWTHVGLSYDTNGAMQFYVNGQPAGAPASAPPGLQGYVANSVNLGALFTWTGQGTGKFGYLDGWMDEIRMWWTVRTPAEVLENYNIVVDEYSSPGDLAYRFDFDPIQVVNVGESVTKPSDLSGTFYISAGIPDVVELDLTPNSTVPLLREGRAYPSMNAQIYYQNNSTAAGYNPNEEHALMVGSVAYALRCDLNKTNSNAVTTSMPFTLVEYSPNPAGWKRAMDLYEVVATNREFPRFEQHIEAGRMIQPPAPLRSVLPDNCAKTDADGPDQPFVFRDRLRYLWAKQAHKNGGPLEIGMRFYYPMQNGFWIPQLAADKQPAPLTEVPWLSAFGKIDPTASDVLNEPPVRVAFVISWPAVVPTLSIADTLTLSTDSGLPAIRGQKSVSIVYQQSEELTQKDSAVLIDPTRARKVELTNVPPLMRAMRDPRTGNTFFSDLDPDLRERLFYVPSADPTERLNLKGMFVDRVIYHYLRLNLMTPDLVTNALDPKRMTGIDQSWTNAVNDLPTWRITVKDENVPFDSLALCTPGFGAGYVTVIFNNSTNIDMVDPGNPIDMAVIRIQTNLFNGRIDIIQSSNPLDKYLTLRHISDFSGRPELWTFEWQYGAPDTVGNAPTNSADWLQLVNSVPGRYTTVFGSSGEFGLGDAWVRCRYKALDEGIKTIVGTNWSEWTAPAMCEGWIKRVLKAINPFDQRIQDFMNYSLNTQLSMVQQAGKPYAGDIPMNMDALNEYGLIPIYQTVLEQSRGLSIDSTTDPMGTDLRICLALMLAAGRLNDLYMVLGNEAYADAMNPSISLGNSDPVLTSDAPSIFAFQNIVPTLLDEELALLRGRDGSSPVNPPMDTFPIYNRLPWNFTADITHGQLAYVLNYGISDLKGNTNGILDWADAAKLYPQGHGDAWGHYLSAIKSYYYLFRHQNFKWLPQLEAIRIGQMETTISALHEKKFAAAAVAKARTGLAIMERTHSQLYEEGVSEPWRVQHDTRTNRVWGVGDWGARVTMGAYFDWVMANALLPDVSSNTNLNPLAVIDRTTVPELTQIVLAAGDAQHIVDMADRGMNPLGLGEGAVPFDISPAEIDQGKTHFEQAYAKAQEALKVARGVFDRVQTSAAAIRDQNEQRDFDTTVLEQEKAYERQLLDIYGFPYQEDIGPGKLYPEGYNGPDTEHYAYINRYDYFGRIPLNTSVIQTTLVKPTIVGNGTRTYGAGDLVPPLPSSDPDLAIEDILPYISPDIAQRYEAIKAQYAEAAKFSRMTRRQVDALNIPELSILYAEAVDLYDEVADTLFGAVEGAIDWFDGVISAPVDAIDSFISQWVGPTETLNPVTLTGPNITYSTNLLTFWIGTDGLPMKPENYTSARRAEGEVQVSLSQYVLALREATEAIGNSETLFKKIHTADAEYRNKLSSELTAYYGGVNAINQMNSIEQIVGTVNKAIALVQKVYDDGMELYNALEAGIPTVAGMSFDIGAIVRGPARIAAAAVNMSTTIQKLANQEQVVASQQDIENGKKIIELNTTADGIFKDSTELAMKVVNASLEYLSSLDKLDVALQKSETFRMQYQRAIGAGDMVQVEREQSRQIWASDLSGRRYRNMAYQIIRNDDLVRYEQTFAMARKYVYLAAKAYDYETGLLRHDGSVGAPGREFLSQIVRSRALGRFLGDGTPLPGGSTGDPGLADIMARMSANWSVLKGRLNFNNPQTETGTFSLRKELFRIPSGDSFNKSWRDILSKYKVADVRDVLEYRTFCLPFTPTGSVEPGLVIPFASTIDFKQNFFGLPLAAGDNAYDSTHFATKVRGVGIWFSNYRNTMLANQPRVYIIPVGADIMRVPDGVGETTRSWSVLDQALPIPFPLSNETWMRTDWNVQTDVLGGDFFARRRFASMRAYHDSGFNVSEMTTNSRLIGRSVWNTRWLLIIPGGTLLSDPTKGLEQFIQGRELAPGSGTYDGSGVTDIKLFFQTYSYSGN